LHLAPPHNAESGRLAHSVGAEGSQQVIMLLHRRIFQGHNGIPQQQTTLLGRAARLDGYQEQAGFLA
jgi:hypothetical protein